MRRARMLRKRCSSRCSCGYMQISTYSINHIRDGIHNNCSYSYTHETGGSMNISRERERTHSRITRRREGITRTCFVYGHANDGSADSLAFSLILVAVACDQTARHGTALLDDDGWEERCRAVLSDRPAPTHTPTHTTTDSGRRTVPGISSRGTNELLSSRTLRSKWQAGCCAAHIHPLRAGPLDLVLLPSPAADYGPQPSSAAAMATARWLFCRGAGDSKSQLLDSGDGCSSSVCRGL